MNLIHETERLYLRVLDASWADPVRSFYEKNKTYFEPVEPPRAPNFYTNAYHEINLVEEFNAFVRGNFVRLFLFHKKEPTTIIGSICFNNIRRSCFFSCLVGYKTDFFYRNHGYMYEGLDYAIHHLMMDEYKMHRIEAFVLPDNHPSIRLLVKLGFKNEGIAYDYAKLNGVWQNHLRFSILAYQ